MTRKILLLISQSCDMDEVVIRNRVVGQPLAEVRTCAEHVETAVNSFLGKVSELDSVEVGVLAYQANGGDIVLTSALSEELDACFVASSTLTDLPHETEVRYRKVPNGIGGVDEVEFDFLSWYNASEGEKVSPFDALEAALAVCSPAEESLLIVHLHTMTSGDPVIQAMDKKLDIPENITVLNFCLTTSELIPSVILPVEGGLVVNPESNFVISYSSQLSLPVINSLEEAGMSAKEGAFGAVLNGKLMDMARLMKGVISLLTLKTELQVESSSGSSEIVIADPIEPEVENTGEAEDGDRWRVSTDEDPAPTPDDSVVNEVDGSPTDEVEPTEAVSDGIDVLVVFDPTSSTEDPMQFVKAKKALGLVLEKLARRDDELRVGVMSLGEEKLTATSIQQLSEADSSVVEEYEEEVVAGGGRIMTIPHAIPWVHEVTENSSIDVEHIDITLGGSLKLSEISEVILVLTVSAAAQTAISSISSHFDSDGEQSTAAWLYVNDSAVKFEMPMAEDVSTDIPLLDGLLQNVTRDSSGACRLVVNGRASKLC